MYKCSSIELLCAGLLADHWLVDCCLLVACNMLVACNERVHKSVAIK